MQLLQEEEKRRVLHPLKGCSAQLVQSCFHWFLLIPWNVTAAPLPQGKDLWGLVEEPKLVGRSEAEAFSRPRSRLNPSILHSQARAKLGSGRPPSGPCECVVTACLNTGRFLERQEAGPSLTELPMNVSFAAVMAVKRHSKTEPPDSDQTAKGRKQRFAVGRLCRCWCEKSHHMADFQIRISGISLACMGWISVPVQIGWAAEAGNSRQVLQAMGQRDRVHTGEPWQIMPLPQHVVVA